MTHDPLCTFAPCECYKDGSGVHSCGTDTCQCDLIAKVRAGQTQQILSDLASGRIQGNHDDDWILNGIREHIRKDTLDKACNAVVAVASAGLGPAVPHRMFVHTSSALAAIDALRGEL